MCLQTINTTTTTRFYGSLVFVRDNPGEPVPEETIYTIHKIQNLLVLSGTARAAGVS